MKKILVALLAVCLCVTTVFTLASCGCESEDTRVKTTSATQPDLVDEKGFGYTIVDSKTLTIIKYEGTAMEIEIPSEYDGKPVTEIGDNAFRAISLKSVIVPDSIEVIGDRAFSNCSQLTNISLPEGLKEIKQFAFSYDVNLKSINLPSTLTTLGQYSFTGSGLESIKIPESITSLEHFTFYQCLELESAEIPATVKEFGKDVFAEDEKLTIIGEAGSEAEKYADKQEIKFKEK